MQVNHLMVKGRSYMPAIDEHPTVQKIRSSRSDIPPKRLTSADLKQLCLDCGADDAGLVSIEREELDDQREDILRYAPWTKSLLTFVCKIIRLWGSPVWLLRFGKCFPS